MYYKIISPDNVYNSKLLSINSSFAPKYSDIISEYFGADEEFIDDQFELYVSSGDIIL